VKWQQVNPCNTDSIWKVDFHEWTSMSHIKMHFSVSYFGCTSLDRVSGFHEMTILHVRFTSYMHKIDTIFQIDVIGIEAAPLLWCTKPKGQGVPQCWTVKHHRWDTVILLSWCRGTPESGDLMHWCLPPDFWDSNIINMLRYHVNNS
jgi:hypothetical protein